MSSVSLLGNDSPQDDETSPVLPKKSHHVSWVGGISLHDDLKNAPPGFRKSLGVFIESRKVQILVVSLTVLDLIIVAVDLFIEEHYRCREDEHKDAWVEITEEVLGYTSITILVLLGTEILLVLIAFGLKFFQHPFYVLDMVVIGLSLVFELVFKEAVGALLVIFRLWRLVRIAHGVAVGLEERTEQKMKVLEQQNKKLKEILDRWKVSYHIEDPVNLDKLL
eukprot:Phypoly_transcript_15363.p1 GENE.Phypoly_transcript_15363~~Phypoly_transcript_15363.p1  ORF type:complete len:222 (+),score=25.00 Phypoly_transcript_15363:98-763(+)